MVKGDVSESCRESLLLSLFLPRPFLLSSHLVIIIIGILTPHPSSVHLYLPFNLSHTLSSFQKGENILSSERDNNMQAFQTLSSL